MSASDHLENIKFEDWEAEQMKDPQFRAALLKIAFELPEVQALVEATDLLLDTLPDTCQFDDDPSWNWAWEELSGQAQDRVKFARDGANAALAPFKDLDKGER